MSPSSSCFLPAITPHYKPQSGRWKSSNLAARIADYAGIPVNRVLGLLPKAANRQLSGLVRTAVMKGLEVAVDTLDEKPPPAPAVTFSSFLAGVTGGVERPVRLRRARGRAAADHDVDAARDRRDRAAPGRGPLQDRGRARLPRSVRLRHQANRRERSTSATMPPAR